MDKVQEIFYHSYHAMRASSIVRSDQTNETVDYQLLVSKHAESFPITTRSSRNSNREDVDSSNISTPAVESIISGQRHIDSHSTSSVAPQISNGRIKWTNTPRQPIPQVEDINQWIGHQLNQWIGHQHTSARSAHHTGTAGSTQSARCITDYRPEITSRRVSLAVSRGHTSSKSHQSVAQGPLLLARHVSTS